MNHAPAHPHVLFTMIAFNLLVVYFPVALFTLWRRPQIAVELLAVFLGLLTGLLDLRSDDTQFTVLLLLVFGCFAGFAKPPRAALSAILLAGWIPVVTVAGLLAGVIHGQPYGVPATSLAFIPALVGTYLGAFVRRHAAGSPAVGLDKNEMIS